MKSMKRMGKNNFRTMETRGQKLRVGTCTWLNVPETAITSLRSTGNNLHFVLCFDIWMGEPVSVGTCSSRRRSLFLFDKTTTLQSCCYTSHLPDQPSQSFPLLTATPWRCARPRTLHAGFSPRLIGVTATVIPGDINSSLIPVCLLACLY